MRLTVPVGTRAEMQWEDVAWNLSRLEHPLEYLIAITPTGRARELLTEANIHRMAMESVLTKALAATAVQVKSTSSTQKANDE